VDGYTVITTDDRKAGRVVADDGNLLVVEQGWLFKHRRPLPRSLAEADDEARVVRATVSHRMLEEAPSVDDEQAVAHYYGLAGDDPDPVTHGHGNVLPDDPATPAPDQVEERAAMRENMGPGEGPNDRSGSTGVRDARP
jgi:hypothetical protein